MSAHANAPGKDTLLRGMGRTPAVTGAVPMNLPWLKEGVTTVIRGKAATSRLLFGFRGGRPSVPRLSQLGQCRVTPLLGVAPETADTASSPSR